MKKLVLRRRWFCAGCTHDIQLRCRVLVVRYLGQVDVGNVIVCERNVSGRVCVVNFSAVNERVSNHSPPAHAIVGVERTGWLPEAVAAASARQAQVRSDVFKEVALDHLASVGPVASAVDCTSIGTRLYQRVEVVPFDGVIVTGQQHSKMRAIRDNAVDQVVSNATQADARGVLLQEPRERADCRVLDGMVCCNQRLPVATCQENERSSFV